MRSARTRVAHVYTRLPLPLLRATSCGPLELKLQNTCVVGRCRWRHLLDTTLFLVSAEVLVQLVLWSGLVGRRAGFEPQHSHSCARTFVLCALRCAAHTNPTHAPHLPPNSLGVTCYLLFARTCTSGGRRLRPAPRRCSHPRAARCRIILRHSPQIMPAEQRHIDALGTRSARV